MFSTTEITSNEELSDNVIHQRLYYAYVEAAKQISGDVLEIGCGVGRGLSAILSACGTYTAIDKNAPLIAQLQAQFPQHKFINANIPPFGGLADNSFDWVITFQVIEHIENDALFMQEIKRVLRPGGKAIITTPNIALSLTRNPWHVREYTVEQLVALMRKSFGKVAVQGITGNQKVQEYYLRNKASVEKITKYDVLNLQHRLPRQLLQMPYDILNRMNRKKLMDGDPQAAAVTVNDYFFADNPADGFDFFCIVEK